MNFEFNSPRSVLLACCLLFLAGCASQPSVQKGPDAETTFDGLVKVDNTVMDLVWIKPGLDLSGYSKILPVNAGIEYRAVKDVSRLTAMRSSTTEFPLDEDQKEKIRVAISDAFRSELEKLKNYTFTDKPAPDTLLVVGKILDVVSNVPPEPMGRGGIYLTKLGEATLVIEFHDSQSGETLLRAVDRDAIEPSFVSESNVVTNTTELKRFARQWARLLREGLDGLHESQLGS
jgi:hypothetical protein